uniref:Dehydrogenase/reductase (SDR family) member 1 n=1 Tax=Callorhinchus milii TaxID=7868 RepID=A0A4W3GCJ3_CALMI
SLSLSLSHTPLSPTGDTIRSVSLSVSHTSLSVSLTHSLSHPQSLTHTLSLSLSLSVCLSHSLPLSHRGHYICSVYAAQAMVKAGQGIIVVISSMGGLRYIFNVPYGVGKAACDRLAADCAEELRPQGVSYVSLWPGTVQTETLKEMFLHSQTISPQDQQVKLLYTVRPSTLPGQGYTHSNAPSTLCVHTPGSGLHTQQR